MDCRTAKRLIPAFIDTELERDKAAQLSQHLASCHSCREEMDVLTRTMAVMEVCGEIEPSFILADIRERAARRRSREPVFTWLSQAPRLATASMVVAALAAGSISGIYYGSHKDIQSHSHIAASNQHVSSSFGLDAFDDGLAGAVFVADAKSHPAAEVTR